MLRERIEAGLIRVADLGDTGHKNRPATTLVVSIALPRAAGGDGRESGVVVTLARPRAC